MIDKPSQVRRANALIEKLAYSGFYGTVTLSIENGHLVFIETIEKIKVPPGELDELLRKRPVDAEMSVRELQYEDKVLVSFARRGKLTKLAPDPG